MTTPKISPDKRLALLFSSICLIVFVQAYWYIFDTKLAINGDNTNYYLLAKSILQGGYKNLMAVDTPATNAFPPGYPLLLSIPMIFTKNLIVLKMFSGILFFAGGLTLFHTLRNENKSYTWLFLAVTLATFINPSMLNFATNLMSETSYFLCISLAALFLSKVNYKDGYKDKNLWVVVCITAFAYHIRPAAIAILGAVIFHFIITKKWKHILMSVAGFIILLIPWMLRGRLLHLGKGNSVYIANLIRVNPWDPELGIIDKSGIITRLGNNFRDLISKEISDALFSANVKYYSSSSAGEWIFGILLIATIIFGLYKIKKLNFYFIGIILATGVILLPWNGGGGTRYITSIIPILYLGLFMGAYHLFRLISKENMVSLDISVILLIVVFFSIKPDLTKLHVEALSDYPSGYKNYFDVSAKANELLPDSAIVCCRKPSLFYYFGERPAHKYKKSKDQDEVIRHMYNTGVTHVVFAQLGYTSTKKYLHPAIQNNKKLFRTLYHLENPHTYLIEFKREAAKEHLKIKD